MRRVWVDSWQMQCCVDPFEVNSQISWSTATVDDCSWFEEFLDSSIAASITHHEVHHAQDPSLLGVTRGVVRSIDAVYCRYALDGRAASPVPGSGELRPRLSADGWEEETTDDEWVEPRFVGYLVQLELVSLE
jgi:hypothetical protein